MKIDLEMDLPTIIMGTGEIVETFFVLHRLKGETFNKVISYRQPRSDQLDNFAFRKPDNRFTSGFTHYEQNLSQNIHQMSSNVVCFTTPDDSINEISDLCPLNY